MLLEGRKHPRTDDPSCKFLSAHDPLIELPSVEDLSFGGVRLATKRSRELGSHVDVIAIARVLKARARVVYCRAIGPETFAVGLDLIARDDGQAKPCSK